MRLAIPLIGCALLLGCGQGAAEQIVDSTTSDTTVADSSPTTDTTSRDTTSTYPVPAPATLGGDRPASLRVPSGYDATEAHPVVILLGGYDYFSRDLDSWIGLSARVDALGVVLLMPDGLVDTDGSPYWNATDTCCDFYGSGVDDVGYLTGLLDELTREVHIDPARIWLVGHSNGGFMAYRMACEFSERIAAIVSIAGSGWREATDCATSSPVSVLQVHGLDDDVMPFVGDSDAPGALEMMNRWGARAGCDLDSWRIQADRLELSDDNTPEETEVHTFEAGCQPGVDVRLWAMTGNDHYPAFRTEFVVRMMDWLSAQSTAARGR